MLKCSALNFLWSKYSVRKFRSSSLAKMFLFQRPELFLFPPLFHSKMYDYYFFPLLPLRASIHIWCRPKKNKKKQTFTQTSYKSLPMALQQASCCALPLSLPPPRPPPPCFCSARSDSSLVDPSVRFHLRTVLWRADMQALVFHQNANNIICNIQGNIIVVLIGEKNCWWEHLPTPLLDYLNYNGWNKREHVV